MPNPHPPGPLQASLLVPNLAELSGDHVPFVPPIEDANQHFFRFPSAPVIDELFVDVTGVAPNVDPFG